MAHRVHPAVKGVEPAGSHALGNGRPGQTDGLELGGRDQSVLPPRHRRDPPIDRGCVTFVNPWFTFVAHPPIVTADASRVSA